MLWSTGGYSTARPHCHADVLLLCVLQRPVRMQRELKGVVYGTPTAVS
jgi:hypothetical protein